MDKKTQEKIAKLNDDCRSYCLKKDYDKALGKGLAVLKLDENDPAAHYLLGVVYYNTQEQFKAKHHSKKAYELYGAINQLNKEVILSYCNVLIMRGEFHDAIEITSQARQATGDPDYDTRLQYISSSIQTRLGKAVQEVCNVAGIRDSPIINNLSAAYLISQILGSFFKSISIDGGCELVYEIIRLARTGLFNNLVFGLIFSHRIGHLAGNNEIFLRLQQLGRLPSDKKYVFVSIENPSNRFLLDMYKRHLTIIENDALRDLLIAFGSHPICRNNVIDMDGLYTATEYEEFTTTNSTLCFTPEEEERGQRELRNMGIGENDWFVCVFSRDSEYLNLHTTGKDWSYQDYRDDDINTYRKAIKYILDKGGYVVRLGQYVSQKLNLKHKRLIHYAGSNLRNDFMDIYLGARCRFIMGSVSGIINVATDAFETPYLGINFVPVGYKPMTKKSMYIPKKIEDIKTGQLVPYKRIFADHTDQDNPLIDGIQLKEKLDCQYIGSTEDEIYDATVDMFNYLDDIELTPEDQTLRDKYYSLYPENHFNRRNKTPIAPSFLKRNYKLYFGG